MDFLPIFDLSNIMVKSYVFDSSEDIKMVNITHSGENALKANKILFEAQKRFGLYGFEKTSMREIATDIGISKATLYYYFPDKEHLFKAVVEMEQESFFQILEKTLKTTDDPSIMMKMFVKIRLDYFKTFFNLARIRFEEFKNMKPLMGDTYQRFNAREEEQIKAIMSQGVMAKIYYIEDIPSMASLFLETLKGLRHTVMHDKELMYVEQKDYELVEKKQNAFTDVFIKGLMFRM